MELDQEHADELRAVILGPNSEQLIAYVVALTTGRSVNGVDSEIVALASRLGLIEPKTSKVTHRGYLVADPFREYTFWIERGRQLPCESTVPHLSAQYFAGKRTLEVGCGVGCNLWSLSPVCPDLMGVEPQPLYPFIGGALCERDGMVAPRIEVGRAEALSSEAGQFDVVLCITAHQYMDLPTALSEMTRVLRTGGEILLVGGTLGTYLEVGSQPIRQGSWRAMKPYAISVTNTLAYTLTGRRLIQRKSGGTTSVPIYPTVKHMQGLLSRLGLAPSRDVTPIYPETCFSYRKL